MKEMPPEELTLPRFQAALESAFRVTVDPGDSVDLTLIEATARRAASEDNRGESFSIIFRGPGDRILPQRIYRMEHDVMGRFDLFIVPVGQDQDGIQYEAIFNRRP